VYERANTVIRTPHGFTKEIPLTEGLLQGCVLSPLLFSLYIADIEKVLKNEGSPGIKLKCNHHLHILLFADDMVLLSTSPVFLQRKINTLQAYFSSLGLEVNLAKTKIVIFRKGGRVALGTKFYYGEEEIEIVPSYTYLGVPFHFTGTFLNAATHFKNKGIASLSAVWKIIIGGKVTSWYSKVNLFQAITKSTTLYSSHIWALRYTDLIEKVQLYFYKRLLGVKKTVPNYLVRLECGVPAMEIQIIKQAALLGGFSSPIRMLFRAFSPSPFSVFSVFSVFSAINQSMQNIITVLPIV